MGLTRSVAIRAVRTLRRPLERFPQGIVRSIGRFRNRLKSRDQTSAAASLNALETAARGPENLMPRILAACEAWATVGEISDRLRNVFGEYREG